VEQWNTNGRVKRQLTRLSNEVGRRVTATVEKYVGGQKSRQEPTVAAQELRIRRFKNKRG
jgi:hypothetical protein